MTDSFLDSASRPRDPQTYKIIGCAMEVHRVLGPGFLEAVYREALRVEFTACAVPFRAEVQLAVTYKGVKLECAYRADFICFDEVIVECKAQSQLTNVDKAQSINYLKATGFRRALLLNFGAESLQYKRIVLRY